MLNTVELVGSEKAKFVNREASILNDAAKRATMSKSHVRKIKRRVLKQGNFQQHMQDSVEQDDQEQSEGPRRTACCCDLLIKNPFFKVAVLAMALLSPNYCKLQQPIDPFPYVIPSIEDERKYELEMERWIENKKNCRNKKIAEPESKIQEIEKKRQLIKKVYALVPEKRHLVDKIATAADNYIESQYCLIEKNYAHLLNRFL